MAQPDLGSSPGSAGPQALCLAISDLLSHLTNRHAPTAHQEVPRFTDVVPGRPNTDMQMSGQIQVLNLDLGNLKPQAPKAFPALLGYS